MNLMGSAIPSSEGHVGHGKRHLLRHESHSKRLHRRRTEEWTYHGTWTNKCSQGHDAPHHNKSVNYCTGHDGERLYIVRVCPFRSWLATDCPQEMWEIDSTQTYVTNDSRLDRFPCIKPYFKTTKTIECADVYYIRAEIVTRAPDESHCFSWLRLLEGSEAVRLVDHANPLANSLFKFYLSIF